MLDFLSIDGELTEALERWRRAIGSLRRAPEEGVPVEIGDPLVSPWINRERIHQLSELDDPMARALVAWATVLRGERLAWPDRVAQAALWHAEQRVDHADTAISVAALRDLVLSTPVPALRREHATSLTRVAGPLSDHTIDALERRFELERDVIGELRFGAVRHAEPRDVLAACEAWLARTHDLVEGSTEGFADAFHATLARDAAEGWPARLTSRWIGLVFDGTDITRGLRLRSVALPRPWGAASFARAIGRFGTALLEASRPPRILRAIHVHPTGIRRHVRSALFASLVGNAAFAQRVLGLSRLRAADHTRAVARAALAASRIDALRVIISSALRRGKGLAREKCAETSARCFGSPLPPPLLGVLPQLRAADAAGFVGALAACETRAHMIDAHDEDWFRNPRAIALLRDEDAHVEEELPIEAERLGAWLERAYAHFERALG